jgi:hypothetical protein
VGLAQHSVRRSLKAQAQFPGDQKEGIQVSNRVQRAQEGKTQLIVPKRSVSSFSIMTEPLIFGCVHRCLE